MDSAIHIYVSILSQREKHINILSLFPITQEEKTLFPPTHTHTHAHTHAHTYLFSVWLNPPGFLGTKTRKLE